jgi:hypothetical protein
VERQWEPVSYSWQGALPERDLPEGVLYNVRISLEHDASPAAEKALTGALEGLTGGGVRVRRLPLLGARFRAERGPWRLSGRTNGGNLRLQVHHRLKGKALERLVGSLAQVPGARSLQLEASRERFVRPYSSVGPCSPCAATRFGPSR